MSFSLYAVRRAADVPEELISGDFRYAPGSVKAFIETAIARFDFDDVLEIKASGHLQTLSYSGSGSEQTASIEVRKFEPKKS